MRMSRILEIAAILLLLTAISCNDTGDTAKKTEYRSTTLVKVDETTEDSISRAEVKTIPDMVKAIDLWNYWTRTGKERKLINHASKVFRENSGPDGNPDFALISALCMSFPYITINQPDSARYYLDYCKNKISENYPIYGTYCNAEAEYAIRFDFDYPKGMAYLTKAYELTRKLPEAENSPAGSVIMSNISMLYYRRRDTAGLKYAQRACELAKKSTKDLYPLYISYIMLGQQEYLSGKYRQAIDHSIEALNIVTSHPEFRQGISDIYITMADSYSALGDNNAARIYYNNAFDNISTTTDKNTHIRLYLSYADYLFKTSRYDEAIRNYKQGYRISEDYNIIDYRHFLLLGLSESYQEIGQKDSALFYYKEFHTVYNRAFNLQKEKEFNQFFLNYEKEKYENDLNRQKLEIAKREKLLVISSSAFFAICIAAAAIIIFYRKKNRMYRQVVEADQQRLKADRMKEEIASAENSQGTRDKTEKELFERLEAMMKSQKLYRNSNINIENVAAELSTNRTYLSSAINKYSGMSFPNYINKYRISEAVSIISDPDNDTTIKELYIDLGYKNRNSFDHAFIKETGMTPVNYREQISKMHKQA